MLCSPSVQCGLPLVDMSKGRHSHNEKGASEGKELLYDPISFSLNHFASFNEGHRLVSSCAL